MNFKIQQEMKKSVHKKCLKQIQAIIHLFFHFVHLSAAKKPQKKTPPHFHLIMAVNLLRA